MTDNLKTKLKTLPTSPGVYFHKNTANEIIYIGKAAVLKNRVRQYFQSPSQKDAKTRALVAEIADTDWIVVDTELDALFLESEMVKRYMPKWNILLRDDKSVSYVRIDMKSAVPYVSLTRNPEDDKAEYFGPYYGKSVVEKALRILRRIFPYYSKPYNGKRTLDTDLGLSPGVEINKITPTEYKQNLRHLISYLKGNRKQLIRELEKLMKDAAKASDFEKATAYRNQFYGLRGLATKIVFSDKEFLDISNDAALHRLQIMLRMSEPPRRIEGYDISHQSGTNVAGSMVCFINGVADRTKYRRFKLRTQRNDDTANLREIVTRRLRHLKDWGKPDLVVVDGGIGQVMAVHDIFAQEGIAVIGRDKSGDHSRNAKVKIVIPEAPGDYQMVELAESSHVAKLIARIDDESHRFAIQYHSLLKRKNALE
ncbi:MAG: UvrB/UvrC motif-containing protein [Candidatus Nomurabacteria bacterium]|jgi:excinuclease ABC subunit C|nr:UvrB/UvrC motif-containing protein [Candidatus Nomurabacteria bacterium]